MICFTQQKEAVMNVMSLFSPNGPNVVVLSQNKAASYIYQNNYRNHTGIYQPSAAAQREDTAKTFLFRGIVEFCVWLHGGWKPRNCEI